MPIHEIERENMGKKEKDLPHFFALNSVIHRNADHYHIGND